MDTNASGRGPDESVTRCDGRVRVFLPCGLAVYLLHACQRQCGTYRRPTPPTSPQTHELKHSSPPPRVHHGCVPVAMNAVPAAEPGHASYRLILSVLVPSSGHLRRSRSQTETRADGMPRCRRYASRVLLMGGSGDASRVGNRRWPRCMPGKRREEVGQSQVRALRDPALCRHVPCLTLGRFRPRHAVIWRRGYLRPRLENSLA